MISVLLPYRNAGDTLHAAASSVLGDMGPADELVLVDDGSADGGPAIAERLADLDARVIRVATNGVGIARALGRGLTACRGELVARMDADDVSLPGRLAAERSLLEGTPTLGAVATQIELFGAPGPGIHRYAAWQNAIVSAEDHARAIFVESPVCHPSTLLRRAALDGVGGFREGPFPEDYDLWLRLIGAGWGLAKVPQVLFQWRIHPTSTTWIDPRLSVDALRRLRAEHLARRLKTEGRACFGVWGAGPAGRRLARALEAEGVRASFFIDIDPRKIGRTARGAPILGVDAGIARAHEDAALVVVAVATLGARDLVRARLEADGFVDGVDFLCAA